MSRKKARDNVFKCIYQIEYGFTTEQILKNCFVENENNEDEILYITKTLNGVTDKIKEIDEMILANLKNWSIDRIAKIDLAILRLAVYEVKYDDSIPYKVAINEAVELCKMYSTDESPSFVNGVLAKIVENK